MKMNNDQRRMGTALILLLAPAQSVTMERVMIQIIWELVTQRNDTHKTERPELLDDPLQLVVRRCGLLDSEVVPPPGAAHKSRSSSGCLGQLLSWQAVEKNHESLLKWSVDAIHCSDVLQQSGTFSQKQVLNYGLVLFILLKCKTNLEMLMYRF